MGFNSGLKGLSDTSSIYSRFLYRHKNTQNHARRFGLLSSSGETTHLTKEASAYETPCVLFSIFVTVEKVAVNAACITAAQARLT